MIFLNGLDIWYVEHQNFLLDMKIIWLIIIRIIKREGVNASNINTIHPFTDS